MEMLSPKWWEYYVNGERCNSLEANLISHADRYQHFEELHRRLKEFPEYNLHLPPKHFLSTGLDVYVIQERCKLLDQYLKVILYVHLILISSPYALYSSI